MIRALFFHIVHSRDLEQLHLPKSSTGPAPPSTASTPASSSRASRKTPAVNTSTNPSSPNSIPASARELGVLVHPAEIVDYQVENASVPSFAPNSASPTAATPIPTSSSLRSLLRHRRLPLRRPPPHQKTFSDKGADALAAHDLKQAALHRIFGFEIMPPPSSSPTSNSDLLLESLGAPPRRRQNRTPRHLPHQLPHRMGTTQGKSQAGPDLLPRTRR